MNIGQKIDIRTFIAALACLLISFLIFTVNTYAAMAAESTVEYTPSEEALNSLNSFKLEVHKEGKGHLLDDGQKITEYPKSYELTSGTQKIFQLMAGDKAELVSVIYDGENITNKVDADKRITVTGKDKDTVLKVTFSTGRRQGVITGDRSGITGYIPIALLSGLLSVTLIKIRKRKKETQQET